MGVNNFYKESCYFILHILHILHRFSTWKCPNVPTSHRPIKQVAIGEYRRLYGYYKYNIIYILYYIYSKIQFSLFPVLWKTLMGRWDVGTMGQIVQQSLMAQC